MNELTVVPPAETAALSAPETGVGGRPAALDAVNKAKIVALVAIGCNRRMAACEVGCAASTIARTAVRDAEFLAQLDEAQSQADHQALKLLLQTARQEEYWRAAAWIFERRNPEEYGHRPPHTFTSDQVLDMFARFAYNVLPEVPQDRRTVALERMDEALLGVEARQKRITELSIRWGVAPGLNGEEVASPDLKPGEIALEVLYQLAVSGRQSGPRPMAQDA